MHQFPQVNCDVLLDRVFPLPHEEELCVFDPRTREQKLSVTMLDGLLTGFERSCVLAGIAPGLP